MGNVTKWTTRASLGILVLALLAGSTAMTHQVASAATDSIATGNSTYDQFDSIIVAQAQQNGLDPFIIKGQIMLESGFNQWAQSSQINAGCGWTHDIGLMQINPYCNGVSANSLFDPTTNIQIGTAADGRLYQEFGSMDLALQAYNIGAASVAAGQRNWAYSNAVDNYAQQFRNEHNALYGSSGSPPPPSSGTYVVQPGDTLYAIGNRYGVSWQSIAQANGISYPYTIYVGEQLTIPGQSQTYVVQPGDSLYAIGLRYGVSWSSIAQANGISYPYVIYPGETLVIP